MRSVHRHRTAVALLAFAAGTGCIAPPPKGAESQEPGPPVAPAEETATATPSAKRSVLLEPWSGPFGGVPAFGRFTASELKPALETAILENLADIGRIAESPEEPTFENTLVALERAGKPLERVGAVYDVYTSALNDDAIKALQREMDPKLASMRDAILQNGKLFSRIDAVYAARDALALTPEQQRLLWVTHNDFVRAGAKLDDAKKARLAELNQALAEHYTAFSQNVLTEEESQTVLLEREEDLLGLPPSVRDAVVSTAKARGLKALGAVANTRSSVDPFLSYSTRRDLREKVWRMFTSRGDHGDAHDNNAIITKILKLRAERAKLLGYATHAHWRVEDAMAKTPERAMELMLAVWKPAVARVREEVRDMQAIANREGARIKIEPWDYRFYAEKVRKAKYDLDQNDIKPYLSLEKLREGMFWVAGELLGLHFTEVSDGSVPVYHPDVRVFKVTDGKDELVGLWYFDPYARAGKSSGAWMSEYRPQSSYDGKVTPIVSNNSNFVKAEAGAPVLISWDDAVTLFHEFGHALHGLSSRVTYPTLAGTNVARDYVEFPSQLLPRWLATPEVLNRYALHFQSGKPIPEALVRKIAKSETFNQGFATVEALAAALVDMKLHLAGDTPIDPRAFERETLAALGMPREIVMRHRTPHFGHVFSGDGYSAGYYSYLWSDTISADAYEAFTEAGGPYDKAVAERLVAHVFSVGNTVDPADGYRAFRGRDPGIEPLMRRRGFPLPKAKAR